MSELSMSDEQTVTDHEDAVVEFEQSGSVASRPNEADLALAQRMDEIIAKNPEAHGPPAALREIHEQRVAEAARLSTETPADAGADTTEVLSEEESKPEDTDEEETHAKPESEDAND